MEFTKQITESQQEPINYRLDSRLDQESSSQIHQSLGPATMYKMSTTITTGQQPLQISKWFAISKKTWNYQIGTTCQTPSNGIVSTLV